MGELAASLIYIAVASVFVAVGAYADSVAGRKARALAHWRRAAEACGLADVRWSPSRLGEDSHLMGRSDTLLVRFQHSRRRGGVRTRVVIEGPADISLRREGLGTAVQKSSGASEVEVGDTQFDREVFVAGPSPTLHAVLDVETRRAVLQALRGELAYEGSDHLAVEVQVEHGALSAEVLARRSDGFHALAGLLAALLDTARRLVSPEDVPGRLAHNARQDPIESVRLHNLSTLVDEHWGEPVAMEALRAALGDPSDEVRLRAATQLGDEGHPVLIDIAARKDGDEQRAARAVKAVGQHFPAPGLRELLGAALRARRKLLAQACIEAAGRPGAAELIDRLASVVALRDDVLSAAAARALGRTALPAAEPPLLTLLQSAPETALAAAEALLHVGTTAAVLPLRELAASEGGALRRAALAAVAEIQARVSGAAPGQVSLAGSEAGTVTLADETAGHVSLHDGGRAGPDPDRR
jgi:HEAT repeat protein